MESGQFEETENYIRWDCEDRKKVCSKEDFILSLRSNMIIARGGFFDTHALSGRPRVSRIPTIGFVLTAE